MPAAHNSSPRKYLGVMVSSTFMDLEDHRAALIRAIKMHQLTDVAMENDSAGLEDVIDSSLRMVRDCSAYVSVIGKRYGQTPPCPRRNPNQLSVTELEFNEAVRLGRPILLFIMGKNHLVLEDHIDIDPARRAKLEAFRERAKKMGPDSLVHRVYATFDSLEDFQVKIAPSVAALRQHLDTATEPAHPQRHPDEPAERAGAGGEPTPTDPDSIPKPPAFYAEPRYSGSHTFVGRRAELETLDDWAQPANPHTVLLFDAIGGNGKSMLTWEWTTNHATRVRTDWAGRFWYSFYERGAVMTDFCRRALAYVTGKPLEKFRRKRAPELADLLLRHLQKRPWLFVLDGLERVLVAYHRIDAAELSEEEANTPTDKIVRRDPCAAIRPEDDYLLRALATASPSKVLVSSRLVPRVLLNASSQPMPGVQRISLPGLRPADAEALLRSCGVTGNSGAIQQYLTSNCDCHPLVVGVLAGLVNDYFPDKGNFDAWAADLAGGGRLDLASLDLVQRRNHILHAGLDATPDPGRQLLSTLALLSEAVDSLTLGALNPHLPPEPEKVNEPDNPERSPRWKTKTVADKADAKKAYQAALQRRAEYERAVAARLASPEFRTAPQKLADTVRDLEHRGLLQYDRGTKRYDLHPVVRGVASGRLQAEERDRYGQRVVDHFSAQTQRPYEEAETLDDLRVGIHIVRTLLKMGRFQEAAANVYEGDLAKSLQYNLEAYTEILALLQPFFPTGWDRAPDTVNMRYAKYMANYVGNCLVSIGGLNSALAAYSVGLSFDLTNSTWSYVYIALQNISLLLYDERLLSRAERIYSIITDLTNLTGDEERVFRDRQFLFICLSCRGQWTEAESIWIAIDRMGRNWNRAAYRPGEVECDYAQYRFWKGDLRDEQLATAERLATQGKNRRTVREIHALRGAWRMEQGQWALAAASLHEAVRMARGVGITSDMAEAQLARAKFHLGQLTDPRREAEHLSQAKKPAHLALAELWLDIGDREQAKKHALAAYRWAWADGEPYVHRYELNKATALLQQLGAEIPNLPPHDPSKDEKFPWEDQVVAAIEKLRAEKAKQG